MYSNPFACNAVTTISRSSSATRRGSDMARRVTVFSRDGGTTMPTVPLTWPARSRACATMAWSSSASLVCFSFGTSPVLRTARGSSAPGKTWVMTFDASSKTSAGER